MTITKGFLCLAAFKKATVWGTPVACGAGDGVGFVSEDISVTREFIEDMQIEGANSTQRQGEAGNKAYAGGLTSALRYEGLEVLIALALGKTGGTPTTVDTTGRQHIFKMEPTIGSLEGLFGTLAVKKGAEVHEYTTCKVNGFELSCMPGERAEITFNLLVHDFNQNTASGTNNNTTIANVTLPANRAFPIFSQMVARINAQSGAALDSTNVVHLSGFTLNVERNHAEDDFTTQFGDRIDEPIQDDWSKVSIDLEFSKFNDASPGGNSALFAAQLTKAPQKMDIVFTGTDLAGAATQYFQHKLYFNGIQFTEGTPNVEGPGRTPFTLAGQAHRVTTAPTGFTVGHTDPLIYEIFNQRTTDPLA
jgi:hypothetical protein